MLTINADNVTYTIEYDTFDLTVTADFGRNDELINVRPVELRWWDEAADELGEPVADPTFAAVAASPDYTFKSADDVVDWALGCIMDELTPDEPFNLP